MDSSEASGRTIVCRGVRGATTVRENSASEILEATRDLLERIVAANNIQEEEIASVFFYNDYRFNG